MKVTWALCLCLCFSEMDYGFIQWLLARLQSVYGTLLDIDVQLTQEGKYRSIEPILLFSLTFVVFIVGFVFHYCFIRAALYLSAPIVQHLIKQKSIEVTMIQWEINSLQRTAKQETSLQRERGKSNCYYSKHKYKQITLSSVHTTPGQVQPTPLPHTLRRAVKTINLQKVSHPI